MCSEKDYLGKGISPELEEAIQNREMVQALSGDKNFISVIPDRMEGTGAQTLVPVICEGDAIGSVMLYAREAKTKMGETEQKLAATAAAFLGRQMEQ